jgi:hypothetical protein
MGGLSLRKWGPCAWNTLHAFAYTTPEEPSIEEQESIKTFLRIFTRHIPCNRCRTHFDKYLSENMKNDTLSTRKNVISFLNDAHNDVNRRLGKPIWTIEQHTESMEQCPDDHSTVVLFSLFAIVAICAAMVAQKHFSSTSDR